MSFVQDDGGDAVTISVKAVPGSARDEIVGPLGDRLKVRVAAPPEGGRANRSIQRLLASALSVRPGDVELIAGHSDARKRFRVVGVKAPDVRERLGAGRSRR